MQLNTGKNRHVRHSQGDGVRSLGMEGQGRYAGAIAGMIFAHNIRHHLIIQS